MTRYLIVAQGEGDYSLDYAIKEYDADTPQEAADFAVADGYGQKRGDDAIIFVCRTECVTRFRVQERPTAYLATEEPA